MTIHARLGSSCFFSLFALVATTAIAEEDRGKFLTRSIYVPVEFKLCKHLHDGVLYQGDQALSVMPAKRIFQFTFYPDLERIEPIRTDVRVEGLRDDGEEFTGRLAVTPWGIFTADHHIELDLDKQLARMRYKIDVRYKIRTLTMHCDSACEKGPEPKAVAADASPSSP